jgi:nucleotide-binding universal stress UspA family protein
VIETAESVLARIGEMAKSTGVDCATIHVKDRLPDEGIIAAAKDNGCDLIVVGSHGRRGLSRLLLGSVASRVVALSPVPVLVCR